MASGEIIAFLNADDYYASNTILEKVVDKWLECKPDLLYGDILVKERGHIYPVKAHRTGMRYGIFPNSYIWAWVSMPFPHPATFIKNEIYKRYGLYDTSFRI